VEQGAPVAVLVSACIVGFSYLKDVLLLTS